MKRIFLALLLLSKTAHGAEVDDNDLKVFVTLAQQERCRVETPPQFHLDPIYVVKDKEDRTYGLTPYRLTLDWCNYHIKGEGKTVFQVFETPKPVSYLQPRLNLFGGFSYHRGIEQNLALSLQVIVLYHAFPYAHLGTQGLGAGVGYYLTPTLSVDAGYQYNWGGYHQPLLGVALGLW